VVSNPGSTPITGWSIQFDQPAGVAVGNAQDGTTTQSGTRVKLTPAFYINTVRANGNTEPYSPTVTLSTFAEPANCRINDLTSSPVFKTGDSSTWPFSRVCWFAVHRPGQPRSLPAQTRQRPAALKQNLPHLAIAEHSNPTEPDPHTQGKHKKCFLAALKDGASALNVW
jgi:hypothetical protein